MLRKFSFITTCFSLALTTTAAFSQEESSFQQGKIPHSTLFGNPEKASPKISPDGSKLAYLAPDEHDVLNVWIRNLESKEEDKLVTSDKKRGISSFAWEYDSQNILYIQDKEGDENWHLYQTNIATRLTRDLTPFEGVRASILEYIPEYPKELLLTMNAKNPALFDVYRLNLINGALDLEVENTRNVASWIPDTKMQVRGLSFCTEDGSTVIETRDSLRAPWKEFIKLSPDDSGDILGFTADGNSVYFVTDVEEERQKLFEVNLETKEKKLLAEDTQYDLSSSALINPTSHQIEAIGVQREKFEWIGIDAGVKKDLQDLQKDGNDVYILSRDLKDDYWVIAYSSDTKSAQYSVYHRPTKKSHFLFSSNPKLDQSPLSPMKPISFTARDGMKLHGYLTLPLHREPKNLSTVLLVHGGPWARDTWSSNPYVQWLADRGYAVLQINFRGSTGYGKQYLNAGKREWGGKMHTDLLDGKKWMVEQGISNPEKVAIFGGSYGGYATLVGLTFTPKEFCCGVDIVGPSNLITLIETIPPYWNTIRSMFDIRMGNIDTEREFLEACSPLFKVDQICKPLLIAQGANDPRVKQSESDQIVAAMKKNKKDVVYLLFEDEGHGFKRPENRMKFVQETEKFLDKYL